MVDIFLSVRCLDIISFLQIRIRALRECDMSAECREDSGNANLRRRRRCFRLAGPIVVVCKHMAESVRSLNQKVETEVDHYRLPPPTSRLLLVFDTATTSYRLYLIQRASIFPLVVNTPIFFFACTVVNSCFACPQPFFCISVFFWRRKEFFNGYVKLSC
jgi:hypothetical protein